jgi:hypothetical protein
MPTKRPPGQNPALGALVGGARGRRTRTFAGAQETYSLLIEQYIRDPAEKDRVFDAIHTMPAVEARRHVLVKAGGP